MFHVDNSTGVSVMPQPSPVTSETELFFTEGGNGVPPTYPGPDWFNVIQSELLNILKAAGIDPDKMDNTQILVALKKLFLSRSNPFGDIKADGAAAIAAALTNLGLREGSFGFRNLVTFTTAGVTSWTVPEELRKGRKCYVKVIGGGASGGIGSTTASAVTCGGGGGGGGVAEGLVDLTGINSVSITVGAGGAPVSGISVNGKNGGSSSFGTYMSASGGYSGGQPSGGLGAVGVGGTINTSLGPGSSGSIASAASGAGNGGSGGGPGGAGSFRDTANGKAVSAVGPGGGGAGLCPNSSTGQSGAGADGAVYIYW
ncbi:hypothetical protein AYL81_001219 [Escherichia coli]|nr:hypothetical protein [Escherichia coli]